MARATITYLSQVEKEFVHEKTLEVLSTVGVAYNTPKALDVLESAGVEVDRGRLTARLTWDVIEPALKTVPRTVLLAGRDPSRDRLLGGEDLVATSDGMTTYVLDDHSGRRREGTQADLGEITRLCDALDEIDVLWPSPQASDVEASLMPLVMQAAMVRNSSKHVQDEVRTPGMVGPILEIYEAAAGAPLTERPYFSVTNCTVAPLQHDGEMTEASLKLIDRGVPVFVLPMPQAGTTGPMTLLGTCIVNMAELLSAVVLFQLGHPGCATISGVGSAVADMRSGGYIAAGPEIGLINLICLEMSRFYGLPTQATGMSADSKAADFQAGSEGGMTALVAALAGADSLIAAGGLDGGRARRRPDRRVAALPARVRGRRRHGPGRRHQGGRDRGPLPGPAQHPGACARRVAPGDLQARHVRGVCGRVAGGPCRRTCARRARLTPGVSACRRRGPPHRRRDRPRRGVLVRRADMAERR